MRYQIITEGQGDTRRCGWNDTATIETTVGTEAGQVGHVRDNGDVHMRSGMTIARQDIVSMAIERFTSHAIDAVVELEDGTRVQRTIRRNVREQNVPAVLAELEAQPNLSQVHAYPEAF